MEIHIDGFLIDLFPLENWIGLFAVMLVLYLLRDMWMKCGDKHSCISCLLNSFG